MYKNAQWIDENGAHVSIRVDIDGKTSFVPVDDENSDYRAIMALVAKGSLVIDPAPEVAPE